MIRVRGYAVAVFSMSGVLLMSCSTDGPTNRADVPSQSASKSTASPTQTAAPSKSPSDDVDWSAPPEYVRFDGWQVDRFPVPSGSKPKTTDGKQRDFSAYIIFKGGDMERISEFYAKLLRREGYSVDVDDYGTVRFAGNAIEGGVINLSDRVVVTLNRAEA